MKILITGADGQLGRAFREILPEATFWTHSDLDLANEGPVIYGKVKAEAPDVLINCAAFTAVDAAETDPVTTMRVNANSVQHMTRALADSGGKLIQISTEYVFGTEGSDSPHTEEEPADPRSMYGLSKWAAELAALSQPGNTVIRTSWVFGDGNNFVKTMLKLGKDRDELSVVVDQVGRPTYALDLARAISSLLNQGRLPEIIHCQNAGPFISWAEFAEAIFAEADLPTKVKQISTSEYIASRPADAITAPRPLNSRMDISRLESLGVHMPHWGDSLRHYIKALAI